MDAELAADLRQRFERARVLALVLEQPRVLDRDRHVRAELPQHRLVHSVNWPFVSLSRLSAPMTRPLRRSGTTSSAFEPGTASTYRGSACTSLTSSGWPSATAAPTRPCPTFTRSVRARLRRIADRIRDRELVALRDRAGRRRTPGTS